MKLNLLPPDKLLKTGNVDHADWNFKFLLGYIQRRRFKLCLELLADNKYNNLLEIGYGSGIFIPELSEYCNNIYGLDVHNLNEQVADILLEKGIKAKLISACAEDIKFENNFFNAVVSISALEFITDLDKACYEIKRVLKKSGYFFVVTPGYSKALDIGLKILTGESADTDFEQRRQKIIPVLLKHFKVMHKVKFPKISPGINLYTALKLSPLE